MRLIKYTLISIGIVLILAGILAWPRTMSTNVYGGMEVSMWVPKGRLEATLQTCTGSVALNGIVGRDWLISRSETATLTFYTDSTNCKAKIRWSPGSLIPQIVMAILGIGTLLLTRKIGR